MTGMATESGVSRAVLLILAALLVSACGGPKLSQNQRNEVENIAEDVSSAAMADTINNLEDRISDLEARIDDANIP